jgi:hypothetical protein
LEQHCDAVAAVHAAPMEEQVPGGGSSHAAPTPSSNRQVPWQQVEDAVHAEPSGMQVGAVQRRTPLPSGRHGLSSQHWSPNWHCSPTAMQQPASPV